jgi:hypothetical protein
VISASHEDCDLIEQKPPYEDLQMTVKEFCAALAANPNAKMHWMLPDNSFVPAHYHITEVGRVQKDFIDCGGTVRSSTACVLQVWVANDVDHRLESSKLASIMDVAAPLLQSDELPVEVEYEEGVISQYPIGGMEVTPSGLLFYLGTKHTACLAPEKCKVGDTGCC